MPEHASLAQLALRWVLMFPDVTTTIPGARSPEQAENNARAAELPALPETVMAQARSVYDRYFRAAIDHRW